MKHLIKIFSVIAFLAILSNQTFAQSESDYKKGNFSLPSYKQTSDWKIYGSSETYHDYCFYKVGDIEGKIFKHKKCGKYYYSDGIADYIYSNLETALKALYVYKKGYGHMDGTVGCY